jgi:hypothetical protein
MVVYPLEFYRRSERRWKHRVKASARSQHDDVPKDRGNEYCPNCFLPIARPLVSRYLAGASLNIIGCASLVSLVGPVVLIRGWFKKSERTTVRAMARAYQRFPARTRQWIVVLI